MPEQTPREIIAAALHVHECGCPDGYDPSHEEAADAVLAALHEAGLHVCREQAGWAYPTQGGGWQVLDIEDRKTKFDSPVYVPVEVSS